MGSGGRLRALISCFWVLFTGASSAAAQATPGPSSQIEVNVNRVFLSVVVDDRQGHTVSDLKQGDFQILDNDKVQVISAFSVQKRAAPANKLAASPAVGNQGAPVPAAIPPSPGPQRFVVFAFDDMHLSIENLAAAKTAGIQAISTALGDSDMAAVVSTSGKLNSGLTRDRAALKDAITSLQPLDVYRTSRLDCPNIGYYQADLIVNKHDEPALQDAARQVLDCNPGIDVKDINIAERQANLDANRALNLGDSAVFATYSALREYVRRMAKLPGQRQLILVSPGFITISPIALTQESRLIDLAAQSEITISALDARGLYTTELDASQHSPAAGGLNRSGGSTQLQSDYRRNDLALAEGAMESLTDGTGGTFFHNRNDLGAGLTGLAAVPECVYLLEFSPSDAKPDGTYHHLKVKVDRDGMEIQARRGYFSPKPDKKK